MPVAFQPLGTVPASQSLIYAFDTNGGRAVQDAGFDGLTDADEVLKIPAFASQPDPSADNYQFYLNTSGDIVTRYKIIMVLKETLR